jgi:hypothetical protein
MAKITIDGVEIDEQKLIDQGWTPPKKQNIEPTEEHIGCLVESEHGVRFMLSGPIIGDVSATLITDAYPIAMIPWHGGECPVPEGHLAIVQFRDGSVHMGEAVTFAWYHDENDDYDIIAYCPIELRGRMG